ncbi:MAG: ATP-binding protein [Treponema sp.]|nr:ATP-binding protein [Treponema sp.]
MPKKREFSEELEKLAEAGKTGNFNITLNYEGLTNEEKLDILLINEAVRNFKNATEYDLMKYKLTSDALGIALWDMDVVSSDPINPDNTFTWSKEFRHMLGFNDERDFPNVTHSWSDRLHPEDKEITLNAFAAHLNDYSGKTPYDIEYRLMRKNGEYRYYHAFGTTLRDKKGAPLRVAGALRDINEEKILIKERTEAEIANQTKSTFLANMSHEIRTPMNAILGITDILMMQKGLSEETESGLDQIHNSCDLLLGIINDILDFSKIEAGKMDIIPAQYIIASLINDSVHLNMMRMDGKPIEFELQVDENLPAKLFGDALRIKQILNNLLSNAFKYTESGKVTLSITSEPKPEYAYIDLIISVRDTGHGMTREQMSTLYEEYSRFDLKANTIEGTGLGLAITQHLIHYMNGSIKVESEPGKGSLFIVNLPQKLIDKDVLGKELAENLKQFRRNFVPQMQRSQITRDPMPYGSVLIVDDVETNLYVAAGLLKPYLLQIETVTKGRDVINKINSGKVYDIIFMDHMMPEMDGIETTQKIRELGYTHTIVALTANAVVGQAEMFLQNGFDDFISKPIDIRQLNFILNKHIRDRQPPDVIEAVYKHMSEISSSEYLSPVDSLLLESFTRDAKKTADLLDELFDAQKLEENDDDLKKFTVAVHGIKSALKSINETKLSELAFVLETAGRALDTDLIKASAPEFLIELRALIKYLELKLDSDNAQNEVSAENENINDLRNKLQILIKLCADFDRKGVLELIAGMNFCSKKTRGVLDIIKEFVLHSEFEKAGNTAKKYFDKVQL